MILTPKGQVSTNKVALSLLNTEFSKKLLRYRELHKLINTYLIPIKENLDKNKRLHSTFNQGLTKTGRLSSSNPINLQNIPARTELGKKVRSLFIVEKNYKLCCLDFSQIELRLIAHYSQDKNLLKAYKEGVDVHEQTAKGIFNTQSPSKEQRFIAKTTNFSISYGAGPKRLAQTLNTGELGLKISDIEARTIIERFNSFYPGLDAWKRQVWYYAERTGKINTLMGRVIPIVGFKGFSWKERSQAERDSVSYLIQGSAADIMKKGIIDICVNYPDLRIISTVHDELLLELKDDSELDSIKKILESTQLSVPLKVEGGIVQNWGEK